MSAPWFFHRNIPDAGQAATLDPAEAKHAGGSKRLRDGDAIVLFDGAGTVAAGRLIAGESKRDDTTVEIQSVDRVAPLKPVVRIASAVPKGDRLATMLNMLAQLGVASFVPLQCERSIATGGRGIGSRGQRIVLEACKQARCPHAMCIEPLISFEVFLNEAAQRSGVILLADASGRPFAATLDGSIPAEVTAIIGPEGGFSDHELQIASESNVPFVSLSPTTLRVETASIAFASVIRATMGA